jgi:tRNA threonylcarbamoyladenosine modification (KEOPS) complex Cgi121 subunit
LIAYVVTPKEVVVLAARAKSEVLASRAASRARPTSRDMGIEVTLKRNASAVGYV